MSVDQLASALVLAHREKRPAPRVDEVARLGLDEAYLVQSRVFERLWERGSRAVPSYKVSLVTREIQQLYGTDEPALGAVPPQHVVDSGSTLALDDLFCPILEPELVFVATRPLSAAAGVEEILDACLVAPGIEVPDSRYAGWYPLPDGTVTELVADGAFAGRIVCGEPVRVTDAAFLAGVEVSASFDGELFARGTGTQVMGNPVNAVAWLSRALAAQGRIVQAGSHIASGTFADPVVVRAGTFRADYEGIGSVEVSFA
ncbi:hypothetical protein ABT297_09475 [Dactylosporangium sp. NPDC000555]|uniref:2-keto-4-pentenoate hydratase n=1 Tax=Dactylosporangium sp. NPDC000555 TaxID=3154260 RepID=UPI00332DE393